MEQVKPSWTPLEEGRPHEVANPVTQQAQLVVSFSITYDALLSIQYALISVFLQKRERGFVDAMM